MGVESGNGRGVWKRAWSLETGVESGNGRGVWKPPWSLETGVESGNHLGVWKPLWSLETTLESGNRLGVWKPPSKNVGQILLSTGDLNSEPWFVRRQRSSTVLATIIAKIWKMLLLEVLCFIMPMTVPK
jgi:hypothetical protein